MKTLFEALNSRLEQGLEAVLVTVIAGSGSTPRAAGARMLVDDSGRVTGTIGGGGVEYKAEQLALDALHEKSSYVRTFRLTPNQVEDLGMVCGGDVDLHFQFISPADRDAKQLIPRVLRMFERDEDAWIVTDLSDAASWTMGAYSSSQSLVGLNLPVAELRANLGSRAGQAVVAGRLLYIEPLVFAGRVIVFGGGHISQELVPVLARVGFPVVVVDDRSDYASHSLFPEAQNVVQGDFSQIRKHVNIKESDYVIIMTRGHKHDYDVERQILQKGRPRYVGVIGSRSKRNQTRMMLMANGIPEAALDMVHTPIGIDIKAETPAEIAVSIAAELIMVRKQSQHLPGTNPSIRGP